MSETPAVPAPVARFVAAINAADTDAFVAVFADDGFVEDWGTMYAGPAAVRRWASSDAIGAGAQMTILSASTEGEVTTTRFDWRSRVFTGQSAGIFTLRGDEIVGFVIPSGH